MIMSFVAATVATTKILTAVKLAAAVGPVFIAAQPVVDEIKRNRQEN